MPEALSNQGSTKIEATETTNVTGQMTPIVEWSPIDGLMLVLLNRVPDGSAEGVPIYADLRDSNDNPLPLDTDIVIEYDAPSLDKPQQVSYKLTNIRYIRQLSLTQQQNDEYIDRTKHELKGQAVEVRDIDTLQISVNSSAQIDWTNSALYIDRGAVELVSE